MTEPVRGQPRSIAAYYDQTWMDYRMLWLNPANRAMHFGYWDDTTKTHAQSLAKMNDVLAGHARLKAGQLVLDAGCGVGGTALHLAAAHDVKVIGITVTPSQVKKAGEYAESRKLTGKVHFGVQDYTRTAFRDETFDVVYGLETVNYAVDKRNFIAEAHRLLKPGGRLVVQDGFRADRKLSEQENSLQESWLSGWMVPNLASRRQFAQWTGEAGFKDVEDYDCTPNVMRSCRRLYRITMACYPAAAGLHKIGARSDIQHKNVIAARDQYRALQRGLWGYGIVAADKP